MNNFSLFKRALKRNRKVTRVFRLFVFLALLLITFNLVRTPTAQAATITVDTTADEYGVAGTGCALREAIEAANTNAAFGGCSAGAVGVDTITLPASTFTLTITGINEDLNATGDLDIINEGIIFQGAGVTATIIDANRATLNDRAFDIRSGVAVTFNDLTIQNGAGNGGAIRMNVNNAALTINSSRLADMLNGGGGSAIHKSGSGTTLTVNDSTFDNNQSGSFGGGIYSGGGGAVLINRSTFVNNSTSGQWGGGVFSDAPVQINNSTFNSNMANGGGGAIGHTNTLIVSNSTFYGNSSSAGGQVIGRLASSMTFQNNIMTGYTGSACNSFLGTSTNNLIDDASCGIAANPVTNFDTTLQDNGGPTETHAIFLGSNAFDSGVSSCPDHASAPLTTDQRGVARPQSIACDIGAYEYDPTVMGGASGGLGPGGIGHTNGSTTLEVWWRADAGVTESGGSITNWADQSGNGNNADGTGHEPALIAADANLNNRPSVDFDGSADYFSYAGLTTSFTNSSWFGVFEADTITAGCCTALMAHFWASTGVHINLESSSINQAVNGRSPTNILSTSSWSAGNQYILGLLTTNTSEIYSQNGNLEAPVATTPSNQTYGTGQIGAWNGGRLYNGRLPEIIIFSSTLQNVERILVDNYLSSKYEITLGANDLYDGDTGANGDFDLDAAGIGQFGGNQHVQSHSAGIIVRDVDFLQDDGDWLTFGHRNFDPGETIADLPTTGDWATAPSPKRWLRHWYFDRTDVGTTGGTVDLVFDQSEGDMDAFGDVPSAPVSNYRLLGRSGDTGIFSDITAASGATVIINGDQIMFLGVDVSVLGSNFTVGSLDEETSPTAINLLDIASGGQNAAPMAAAVLALLFGGITLFWIGRWNLLRRGNKLEM